MSRIAPRPLHLRGLALSGKVGDRVRGDVATAIRDAEAVVAAAAQPQCNLSNVLRDVPRLAALCGDDNSPIELYNVVLLENLVAASGVDAARGFAASLFDDMVSDAAAALSSCTHTLMLASSGGATSFDATDDAREVLAALVAAVDTLCTTATEGSLRTWQQRSPWPLHLRMCAVALRALRDTAANVYSRVEHDRSLQAAAATPTVPPQPAPPPRPMMSFRAMLAADGGAFGSSQPRLG